MYNEIEELEKRLTRKPAAMDLEPIDVDGELPQRKVAPTEQKKIFDLPEATKFTDPSVPRTTPGAGGMGGEKVVGQIDPDYSGYDDLIKKLEGRKPKDSTLADLLTMGATTGLAALMGRFSIGAKNAGEWGMDRAAKAEKRSDSIEDMIYKLQLDRAAKMAAGKKGTKVKGGAGGIEAKDLYKFRYRDQDGMLRTPQFTDANGLIIKDPSDPIYGMPNVGTLDQKQPDGTIIQHAQMGNQVKTIGGLAPQLKTEKTAKGEMALLNDRTGQVSDLGDYFNKTGAGLSPHSDQQYKSINDKKITDPLLKGLEGSYNDMSLGMTALGRGDIAGALAATKMAASALEKGRMTSDKDLAQVSSMQLGWATRMEKILQDAIEGGKLTEPNRRELESLFSLIEANSRDAYDRRIGVFNKQAQTMLGREWRNELSFQGLPKFTGKKQGQLIDTSIDTARDVMSTGEWTQDLVVNGQTMMRDGKPIRAVYIMKNGKPYALREAKP